MTSLVIYIVSFTIIIGIVSSITYFFNNNIRDLSDTVSISSEYNKFNLYFLKYTKGGYDCTCDNTLKVVSFGKGATTDKFTLKDGTLYFNKIKLCKKVDDFQIRTEQDDRENKILKTLIKINGTTYTTDYVLE